jgi:hypothetical protein
MKNTLLNQKVNRNQTMFIQRHCDKHEYVMVTQTTTNNAPFNPINESSSWLQCKHCGQCIEGSHQKIHN